MDGAESPPDTPTVPANTGTNSPQRSEDTESEYSGYGRPTIFTDNDDESSHTAASDLSDEVGRLGEGGADSASEDLMGSQDIIKKCKELRETNIPPNPYFADLESLGRIGRSAQRINKCWRALAKVTLQALEGAENHCSREPCRQNAIAFAKLLRSGPVETTDQVLKTVNKHVSTWDDAARDYHAAQRDGTEESDGGAQHYAEFLSLTIEKGDLERTVSRLTADLERKDRELAMALAMVQRQGQGQGQGKVTTLPQDDEVLSQAGSIHKWGPDELDSLFPSLDSKDSMGESAHDSTTRDKNTPDTSDDSSSPGTGSPAGSSPSLGGLSEKTPAWDLLARSGLSDGSNEEAVNWRERAQEELHRAKQQRRLLERREEELEESKRELEESKRELEESKMELQECKREMQEQEDRLRERPSVAAKRRSSQFLGYSVNFKNLSDELEGANSIPDSPASSAFDKGSEQDLDEQRRMLRSPTSYQHRGPPTRSMAERRRSRRRHSLPVDEEQQSPWPHSPLIRDRYRAASPVMEEQREMPRSTAAVMDEQPVTARFSVTEEQHGMAPSPSPLTDEQPKLRQAPRSLDYIVTEQLRAWVEVGMFLYALVLHPLAALMRFLSSAPFLAGIDWDSWQPTPEPPRHLPTEALGHVLRQVVIFLSVHTYISCHRQRKIWLDANALTRTYLVKQFREGPGWWWLPGVDPDLMNWSKTFSPLLMTLVQTADVWAPLALARLRKMKLIE
ncbi:Uncharacterized protein TCAP_03548 [Tolypocladium capitatum]|uniref:Uncharacterized protein n=1 Tax=Tolypocladium capitatum TaxID=45235 RepID=A0A2K3QG50_9HYPO|nr:Uncharacterized protein TCAP_03548 [Tolypocladium capitatum]